MVWVVFAGLIIWATTNAVNVTDGLDGLAGGSALMGFGAFVIIGYWTFRNPEIYGAVVNPLDMAALAAAFAGACMGFLWFNAAPARIIMGDVGALGIGSALALLALTIDTQLLLLLICGLNVMEAGSVAVQMAVFKASGRKRRMFRMSPIHHHFELSAGPRRPCIIRFWLIAATCVAAALGLFIGDFTRISVAMSGRYLVYGVAIAGAAVVRALTRRGLDVVVADDAGTEAVRGIADELGVELDRRSGAGRARRARRALRRGRPGAWRSRDAPAVRRRPAPPGVRCAASSSWPTAGSRSGPAGLGRCSR